MEKDNVENKVKQVREEFTISQLRLDAMMYVDTIVNCLSPAKETMRCVSVLTVTKDEVWMKTDCGNACLVFNGKEWARIISRIVTKKTIQGIFPLMEENGNPPAGNLEEKQKTVKMKTGKLDYKAEDGIIYDLSKLSNNDQELISQYIGKNVFYNSLDAKDLIVKITGFHSISPRSINMTFNDFVLIKGVVSIGDPEKETWIATTENEAQDASKKIKT